LKEKPEEIRIIIVLLKDNKVEKYVTRR